MVFVRQKQKFVVWSVVDEVLDLPVVKMTKNAVHNVISLLAVDSDLSSVRDRSRHRMESVLENVFVAFDTVQNHLVENHFARWFQEGAGYG